MLSIWNITKEKTDDACHSRSSTSGQISFQTIHCNFICLTVTVMFTKTGQEMQAEHRHDTTETPFIKFSLFRNLHIFPQVFISLLKIRIKRCLSVPICGYASSFGQHQHFSLLETFYWQNENLKNSKVQSMLKNWCNENQALSSRPFDSFFVTSFT